MSLNRHALRQADKFRRTSQNTRDDPPKNQADSDDPETDAESHSPNDVSPLDDTAKSVVSVASASSTKLHKKVLKKKSKPHGFHGPAWFMDHVAKGETVEEARRALGMEPLPGTPASTGPKKLSAEEVEFRRGVYELNLEGMKAVAQPDGYVDPLKVAQYLLARSGLDQPGQRCYRKTPAEEFVEEMGKRTLDVRDLYAAIIAEQEEKDEREARRQALKRKFMPKAQKQQLREEARQAAEKRPKTEAVEEEL